MTETDPIEAHDALATALALRLRAAAPAAASKPPRRDNRPRRMQRRMRRLVAIDLIIREAVATAQRRQLRRSKHLRIARQLAVELDAAELRPGVRARRRSECSRPRALDRSPR